MNPFYAILTFLLIPYVTLADDKDDDETIRKAKERERKKE
jgi:hypothetical protein